VDAGAGAALVTGGHLPGRPCDILCVAGDLHELDGERGAIARSHGTGCTLTAAITAALARGLTTPEAVARAKAFVTAALRAAPAIGHGARPLDHHGPRRG
jgi:hydroxymethylpyrimidine/phosphomethylpyrimidine kinase